MRLKGKVALVTGASNRRSIGWGIAQALADEGADIVINDVAFPQELDARVAELQAQGRRALACIADVSRPEQVQRMVTCAIDELGQIDILASNAGIIRWEKFLDIQPQTLRDIVNVNLKGNIYLIRAVAQHMIERGQGGRIILTSSVQSDMNFTVTPVYGATKRAAHSLVGSLALELAPHNITVNHIGPGWVRSPLNDSAPDQQNAADIENQARNVPLHRAGTIEEMGRGVVYFASSDGDYTTGAFLRIDGGLGISKYS